MSWVRNLNREFDDGFKVEIPSWELLDQGVTALWGPSGSGKTSVFRLLLGLERAAPGFSWVIDGVDVATLSVRDRRLGVVFQTLELFPHMTGEENILFAAESRTRPLKEARAHLDELVATLGLATCLGRPASVLSGGEKQRVAIARALIGKPRVLLLDEPFSALDADLRAEARALVRRAIEHEKLPVLLVTHDRQDLEAFSGGKLSEIRNGRLVGESTISAKI